MPTVPNVHVYFIGGFALAIVVALCIVVGLGLPEAERDDRTHPEAPGLSSYIMTIVSLVILIVVAVFLLAILIANNKVKGGEGCRAHIGMTVITIVLLLGLLLIGIFSQMPRAAFVDMNPVGSGTSSMATELEGNVQIQPVADGKIAPAETATTTTTGETKEDQPLLSFSQVASMLGLVSDNARNRQMGVSIYLLVVVIVIAMCIGLMFFLPQWCRVMKETVVVEPSPSYAAFVTPSGGVNFGYEGWS